MSEYGNDYAPPPPSQTDGLTDNVAGGLAYITIIPAIIFLVLAPYNRRPSVRFHAFQCIFLFVAGIVSNLLHIIPILGTILSLVLSLIITVMWLIAMIQAFMGKTFVIPFIGPLAQQAAASS